MAIVFKKSKLVKPEIESKLSNGPKLDKKPGEVIEFSHPAQPTGEVQLTEDDIAEDFAQEFRSRLRFDHHSDKWYFWNGVRWLRNETGLGFDHARKHCRKRRGKNTRMASKKAAEGVEIMASRDRRLAVTSDIWDLDPFLLGTPDSTVDLTSGQLKPPSQVDFITKLVSVPPAPKGTPFPVFEKFLNEATSGDPGLQRFLKQWAGYCLTGDTREQALLFIYGTGGNWKGVFVKVITEIMADYATAAATDTFVASRAQRHLTELAMLKGARLVTASETEQNQKWSESRVNQLTGNDPVTANFMRQDHFTFIPKFKLMLMGNHKPKLGTVNEAAKRRFNVVPFMHKPQVPDPKLETKLRGEYPAILRWMIDGCLDWQANGLIRPEIVTATTSEYFEEQDLYGRWIAEKCESGPGRKESASKLYASFREFCIANGENPGSTTDFGSILSQRGYDKKKSSGMNYIGIALKPPLNTVNFKVKT
jgi:putative DNA primase/helicase